MPAIAEALHVTKARRCVTLNLSAENGETEGLTAVDHLEALHKHAPGLRIDAVLADPSAVEDVTALEAAAASMGARVIMRQVRRGDDTAQARRAARWPPPTATCSRASTATSDS